MDVELHEGVFAPSSLACHEFCGTKHQIGETHGAEEEKKLQYQLSPFGDVLGPRLTVVSRTQLQPFFSLSLLCPVRSPPTYPKATMAKWVTLYLGLAAACIRASAATTFATFAHKHANAHGVTWLRRASAQHRAAWVRDDYHVVVLQSSSCAGGGGVV